MNGNFHFENCKIIFPQALASSKKVIESTGPDFSNFNFSPEPKMQRYTQKVRDSPILKSAKECLKKPTVNLKIKNLCKRRYCKGDFSKSVDRSLLSEASDLNRSKERPFSSIETKPYYARMPYNCKPLNASKDKIILPSIKRDDFSLKQSYGNWRKRRIKVHINKEKQSSALMSPSQNRVKRHIKIKRNIFYSKIA